MGDIELQNRLACQVMLFGDSGVIQGHLVERSMFLRFLQETRGRFLQVFEGLFEILREFSVLS